MSTYEITPDKIRARPINEFIKSPDDPRHIYEFQVIGKQMVLTLSQRMVYGLPVVVDGRKYDIENVEVLQHNLADVRLLCRTKPPKI